MKADHDGKPLVGAGSMMLGVRPLDPTQPNKRSDVDAVHGTDIIHAGDGGLSCYSDPNAIAIQSNKLLLWFMDDHDLPTELISRPAGRPHFQIEPDRDMTLDELQALLARTRDSWNRA